MRKLSALALLAVLGIETAQADFLGIYAGIGAWNGDFSGDIISDVNLSDELKLDKDSANHMYLHFEHPLPLLPNIRVARTGLKDAGVATLTSSFTFLDRTFNVAESVATEIDLTHTDVTLYYEVIDIGMDVDIGITARYLDGEIAIDNVRDEVKGVLPMLYARAKFGLPFTGAYIGGDINAISFGGAKVADYAVKVGWETENFILPEFGIEAGYRRFDIDGDADDVDVAVDVNIEGLFVTLTGHF